METMKEKVIVVRCVATRTMDKDGILDCSGEDFIAGICNKAETVPTIIEKRLNMFSKTNKYIGKLPKPDELDEYQNYIFRLLSDQGSVYDMNFWFYSQNLED